MTEPDLSERDRAMLAGEDGDAARLAMKILIAMARISGATHLIDVTRAHVDGCLYHGRAGLDFARRLVQGGGRVRVPATLNVSSLDLIHPHLYLGDDATARAARDLMDAYVSLGCSPTWTCAPYQLPDRPAFGEHVAWAESNAIVFANSVLGARTDRYGDFIDICAAITGRVPLAGLHRDENRRATVLFRLDPMPPGLVKEDTFYAVLGYLIGSRCGSAVPAIDGLEAPVAEDQMKALGAAAASSGAVGLVHVTGVTPEAPTLSAACGGRAPDRTESVTLADLKAAQASLSTAADGRLTAVSLGGPHFSVAEFEALIPLLDDFCIHPSIEFYVSTGRAVLAEIERRGWADRCTAAGIRIVTDTCTYITPILRARTGVAMTNSAKWAYYAPGNLGIDVAFGTLRECVESARRGFVWRDESFWARG